MKKIAVLSLFATIGSVASATDHRPNIVFFLMDDLGYGDPSIMGSDKIETPNIDAIARNGKILTTHYSGSPVSAPSRSVLLTGLHTGHSPIRGNDEGEAAKRGDVWDMVDVFNDPSLEGQAPMPASTRTLAHDLQSAGYVTACIGKWGLGGPGSASAPNLMGFDFFYGYNCQRVSHGYYPSHLYRNAEREYINPPMLFGQTIDKEADPMDRASYEQFNRGNYAPDLMLAESLRFVEQNRHRPFFMWWTTPLPHASLQAPQRWIDHYVKKFGNEKPFLGGHYFPVRSPKATYAAMVSYVDECIGRIVQKLKDDGLYENTIIIFTSDNGPSSEGGGNSPWFDSGRPFRSEFGRGKGFLFEGGIRVPTFVSWSGHIEPGTSSDMISGFQDWRATLCDVAGVKRSRKEIIDGVSLMPTLTGRGQQQQHDFLYWEYTDKAMLAIRQGKWKMIVTSVHKEPAYLLFDLEKDMFETADLSKRYPEVVEGLKQLTISAHVEPENPRFRVGLPLK